jgi:hypothetical protein
MENLIIKKMNNKLIKINYLLISMPEKSHLFFYIFHFVLKMIVYNIKFK